MNKLEQIEQRFAIKEDQTYSDASPEIAIAYLVKRLKAAEAVLNNVEFTTHYHCRIVYDETMPESSQVITVGSGVENSTYELVEAWRMVAE